MQVTVGYNTRQYPEIRNIINKVPHFNYVECKQVFRRRNFIERKVRPVEEFIFNGKLEKSVDLSHYFNYLSMQKTPWLTTYETILPRQKVILSNWLDRPHLIRGNKNAMKAVSMLESVFCKKLISMSHNAQSIQNGFLENFRHILDIDSIQRKMMTIHPPQTLLSCTPKMYDNSRPLKICLVGHQFFLKGGRELVEACRRINAVENCIELTIVSSLKTDDFASMTQSVDRVKIKRIIDSYSWIKHYDILSNYDVVEVISNSDLGVLPSYAETYGYSVLEFQSLGVPVITTNIRAFPEINNNECGFIINVRKNKFGKAYFKSEAEREELSETIMLGIIESIEKILNNPETLQEKSEKSLIRILSEHSPILYSKKIESIYKEVLN